MSNYDMYASPRPQRHFPKDRYFSGRLQPPTAKATFCTKFCYYLSLTVLQLFNFADGIVGGLLVSFGIYLRSIDRGQLTPDVELEWIGIASFTLGLFYLVVCVFSFGGLVTTHCRLFILPSGYLALFLSICSFIAAIVGTICEFDILDYIDSKGSYHASITDEQVRSTFHMYFSTRRTLTTTLLRVR